MAGVAAAGFLKDFASRLVPTLAFSSLGPVMQLTANPSILESEEGRKEMLAMGAASLLSGTIGAGLGAGLNKVGNALRPGPNKLMVKPEIASSFDDINRLSKLKTPIGIGSSADDITSAYNAAASNLKPKSKQLEDLAQSLATAKSTIGAAPGSLHINQQMPSETGMRMGMIGDVLGGMASWSPIYSAISGNGTNMVDPNTQIAADDYIGALQAQGYGSQEEVVHQQVRARMLQGDGLPYYDYSQGTMFNVAGLPNGDIYQSDYV